ncbi:MAG: hypothetical protein IJX90_03480 [Blautia sp.]|nr:hypothetical protein [Blautia sp.]
MILVEIRIPVLHETIDFRLREDGTADDIRRSLLRSLRMMTHEDGPDEDGFVLLDADSGRILSGGRTMKECGIRNGSSLMLL